MDGWKFWTACGVFVALMWALAYWLRKRRTAALKTAAEKLGLQFHPGSVRTLGYWQAGFELDSMRHPVRSTKVRNLLHRESDGREISIFDYRYTTSHSEGSNLHTMTVLLLESTELDLPQFAARPESVFQKLGHLLGGQDIDFSDHPRFSGKFVLRGKDEAAIRRMMTDEVLRAFEQHIAVAVSGFSFEGVGRKLIVYRRYSTVSAGGLRDLLKAGLDVAEPLAQACRRGRHDIA